MLAAAARQPFVQQHQLLSRSLEGWQVMSLVTWSDPDNPLPSCPRHPRKESCWAGGDSVVGEQVKAGRPCLYVKCRVSVRKELLTHHLSTRGHSKGGFFPLFFGCPVVWGVLVPESGVEPTPPAVEGWSPAPWAAREVWGGRLFHTPGQWSVTGACREMSFMYSSSKHFLGPVVLGNGCPRRDKEPGLKKLLVKWAGRARGIWEGLAGSP